MFEPGGAGEDAGSYVDTTRTTKNSKESVRSRNLFQSQPHLTFHEAEKSFTSWYISVSQPAQHSSGPEWTYC
jgi:hypothetical protein